MKVINKKIKRKIYIIITLSLLSLNISVLSQSIFQTSVNSTNDNHINMMNNISSVNPRTSTSQSYSRDWLENTDFNSGIEPWKNKTIGDISDLEASYSGGAVNYILNGSEGRKEISDINNPEWNEIRNPNLPIEPDEANIGDYGFYVNHTWDEFINQTRNYPSVWWKRTVDMGINMLDYNITSISLNVEFNASVTAIRPDDDNRDDLGSIERPGDSNFEFMGQGDFAEFYVLIQDVEQQNEPIPIAKNNTADSNLGLDAGPIDTIDGIMDVSSDSAIKRALETAFEVNPFQFSIIVGIDMYCEDNEWGEEVDIWKDLYIDYFNLTFTYEKIINDGTYLSWYQIGDMINYTSEAYYSTVRIDDILLNFDYSINQSWPSIADDSRFEIYVNNRSTQYIYPDIKLISYNYSTYGGNFIEARSGGYQLRSLVLSEENISLSIRVFIADEFNFNNKINVSIDNIYFRVSYTVFYNPPPPPPSPNGDDDDGKTETTIIEEPWFNLLIAIAAIAGATCLTGYIVYYIRVLKYPKPVRKVRKYRRTLKKKNAPDVPILGRNIAFDDLYRGKLETIGSEVKRKPLKPVTMGEKSVEKLPKKMTVDKVDKLIGKTKK